MPIASQNSFARTQSRIMYGLCVAFTVVILLILLLVIGYLVFIGGKSINLAFFTELPKAQGTEGFPGGMKNGIFGTIILIGIAGIVGVPMGILTGIYLSEYSAQSVLAGPVRFVADVLAGVPSIVVGILGYELLVRPLGNYNGWAGALALAFIMIPIIARTTEEMLRLVPNSYREASIALGATKARTILKVVLPAAVGSLITGVMLAVARVAGETAPLLFTALGSRFNPVDVNGQFPFVHMHLGEPFPSLTKQIFDAASAAPEVQRQQAWAGILILIMLIFVLNLSIRYFARPRARRA